MKKLEAFCIGMAALTALAGCGAAPGGQTGGTASLPSSVSEASSQPAESAASAAEASSRTPESSGTESKTPQSPSSAASSKSGAEISAHISAAEYKKSGTKITAEYPQLDGKAYAGANAALAREACSTIENVKKNPEDGITADTKGSIRFCSQNFVSAVFETNFASKGGAHTSQAIRTVNYDLKEDRTVTGKDLVVNNDTLYKAADAAVKQQLSKELQEYFTPQVLKDSLGQAEFYFGKDGMTVSFTVIYALGDHAEVSIPYGETKGFRTNSAVWSNFSK